MRTRRAISIWVGRFFAVLLGLILLAAVYPDFNWKFGDPRAAWIACVVVTGVLVAAVFIGQRRSRVLEIFGWGMLAVLITGKAGLL